MILDLTDDQRMFQNAVQAFLRERYGWEARLAAIDTSPGWRPEIWSALSSELGVLGLGFDEADGGLGGDGLDQLAVLAPLGEALVVEPYAESVVFAGSILRASENDAARTVIAGLIAGEAVPIVAAAENGDDFDLSHPATVATVLADGYRIDGSKSMVAGAPWASHFLVTASLGEEAGYGVFLVPSGSAGLIFREVSTIDGRRASDLSFNALALPADALIVNPARFAEVVERAHDDMIAAVCAEAVGILGALVRQTVAYTTERRQFGRPLADFQALQHRMADMKVSLEQATAVTFLAASNLDKPRARRRAAVSAAKAQINKACRLIGQSAVQLHGGMGMTMELAIGHFFRRATVIERTYGDTDDHLLRYAATQNHGLI